ncbi:MAG: S-layer homology domain-containing protein [Acidimicrobiia bacterium]|nr:S-layer homology domain-containing protein [Acidimicrobiia bacterium]
MKVKILTIVGAVLLLVAVSGIAYAQGSRFSDVTQDKHGWAIESINWAVDNEITAGIGDGLFAPDSTLTRAQMVTFLKRYHDNVVVPELASANDSSRSPTSPTTTTTTTTSTPAATAPTAVKGFGGWEYFNGSTTAGDYEGYALRADSHSGYSWETNPALALRCGLDSRVFVTTPYLLHGGDNSAIVSWRLAKDAGPTSETWWSDEEIDSTVFPESASKFLDILQGNTGTLYMSFTRVYDNDSNDATFNITGVDQVFNELDCF